MAADDSELHARSWIHTLSNAPVVEVLNGEILMDDIFGYCLLTNMTVFGVKIVKPYELQPTDRTAEHLKRADLNFYQEAMHADYVKFVKCDVRRTIPAYVTIFDKPPDPTLQDPLSFTSDHTTNAIQVGVAVKAVRETNLGLKAVSALVSVLNAEIHIAEVVFIDDGRTAQYQLEELTLMPRSCYDGIFMLADSVKDFTIGGFGNLLDVSAFVNPTSATPFALLETGGLPPAQQAFFFGSAKVMLSKINDDILPAFTIVTLVKGDGEVDSHVLILMKADPIAKGKIQPRRAYVGIKFLFRGKRNQKKWVEPVRAACSYATKVVSNYVIQTEADFPFFMVDLNKMNGGPGSFTLFALQPLAGQTSMNPLERLKETLGTTFLARICRIISKCVYALPASLPSPQSHPYTSRTPMSPPRSPCSAGLPPFHMAGRRRSRKGGTPSRRAGSSLPPPQRLPAPPSLRPPRPPPLPHVCHLH